MSSSFFPPVSAEQVERLVDRNAVDPAEKLVFRIIFIEPLRNLEKHFLRDIVRILGLAQHPECGVVDGPLVPDHQLGEGFPIAIPVTRHQNAVGVVHKYTRRLQKLVG